MSNFTLEPTVDVFLIVGICTCMLTFVIIFVVLQRSVFKKGQQSMADIQSNFTRNYGAYITRDIRDNKLFKDLDIVTRHANYLQSLKDSRQLIIPLRVKNYKIANQRMAVGFSVV